MAINGQAYDPVALIFKLNEIGGKHGVGRVDIVENRLGGNEVAGRLRDPRRDDSL